jgi:hypothetical protein
LKTVAGYCTWGVDTSALRLVPYRPDDIDERIAFDPNGTRPDPMGADLAVGDPSPDRHAAHAEYLCGLLKAE